MNNGELAREQMSMASLVPIIKEVTSSGGEFCLYTRGTSMLPTIKEGVHSVMLASPDNIRIGDIILYERENGQYVLHRLIRIKGDEYFACGDNQFALEGGIHQSSVIAKATKIQECDKSRPARKDGAQLFLLSAKRGARRIRHALALAKKRIIKNDKEIIKK